METPLVQYPDANVHADLQRTSLTSFFFPFKETLSRVHSKQRRVSSKLN